ncbi:hypothetical protein ACKWTF_012935 [Chironomus riparius]
MKRKKNALEMFLCLLFLPSLRKMHFIFILHANTKNCKKMGFFIIIFSISLQLLRHHPPQLNIFPAIFNICIDIHLPSLFRPRLIPPHHLQEAFNISSIHPSIVTAEEISFIILNVLYFILPTHNSLFAGDL